MKNSQCLINNYIDYNSFCCKGCDIKAIILMFKNKK